MPSYVLQFWSVSTFNAIKNNSVRFHIPTGDNMGLFYYLCYFFLHLNNFLDSPVHPQLLQQHLWRGPAPACSLPWHWPKPATWRQKVRNFSIFDYKQVQASKLTESWRQNVLFDYWLDWKLVNKLPGARK